MKSSKWICLVAALAVCVSLGISIAAEGESAKPKHTVKEVMKVAHKDKLLNKVKDGSASADQKAQLLDLYLSLIENDPPQGEEDSWHRLSGAAVIAAAKVVVGREGAVADLTKATNCGACHKVHKPK